MGILGQVARRSVSPSRLNSLSVYLIQKKYPQTSMKNAFATYRRYERRPTGAGEVSRVFHVEEVQNAYFVTEFLLCHFRVR